MRLNYHGWTKTATKWPNNLRCRTDSYPFVGVALTLLVAFMLETPAHLHHGIIADLPHSGYASQMPKAMREDAQIVSVMRDGRIYFGNTPVSAEDLPDKFREGLKKGAEKKVYIRADARARYVDVKQVLVEIRQAGIENICFLTREAPAVGLAPSGMFDGLRD